LLLKYISVFEGTLDSMPGAPCIIPVCQDAKHIASKPLNIPHVHVEIVQKLNG
jgi:hypothetical protein